MELERRQGESPLDHHRRLVYGKLVDKTLADYDYTELSRYVYGKEYSPDVARRCMYGSRYTLELLDSLSMETIPDPELVESIEEQMRELRKERQRFYDQRREYNKLLSVEGRQEHLYESLIKAADELGETVGNIYANDYPADLTFDEDEAVLVLSDWHYGMKVENIYNKFNIEICKKRVKNVVNSASQRLLLHNIRKLHVIVLGDLYHGGIHCSVRVASEELVCDQLMQVSEVLAQSIQELSHYVEETVVYTTYGNHCRTIQNKKDNIHRDNMERIIPWWLRQRFKNDDNIIVAPEPETEFIFAKVAGHDICAVHGDLDKISRGSAAMLSTLFQKKLGKNIEYILLGDKHHRESLEELGITTSICGALCGSDDYASDKRLFSTPSQLMLIVNPQYGVDAEYRLKCE
jgi:hypothetical protein